MQNFIPLWQTVWRVPEIRRHRYNYPWVAGASSPKTLSSRPSPGDLITMPNLVVLDQTMWAQVRSKDLGWGHAPFAIGGGWPRRSMPLLTLASMPNSIHVGQMVPAYRYGDSPDFSGSSSHTYLLVPQKSAAPLRTTFKITQGRRKIGSIRYLWFPVSLLTTSLSSTVSEIYDDFYRKSTFLYSVFNASIEGFTVEIL